MFLDKYSKLNPPAGASEGTSFAPKYKRGKKKVGDDKDSTKKEESGGEKTKDHY